MFSQNTNNGPPFNASIDLELRQSMCICTRLNEPTRKLQQKTRTSHVI